MRAIWRWMKRAILLVLVLVIGLLAPIGYNELACRSDVAPNEYVAILPEAHHRPESRTYLTYPEWHIVHAYDDYAQVIADGDPHDYGYLRGIAGFWTSLCDLSKVAGKHGGFPWETKQMVYVIGVSFSAELLAKAVYEETLGRVATWIRGPNHTALDTLSADQAKAYATFLQQVPWYKWDFAEDAAALHSAATNAPRDRERAFALGVEYTAKAAYAQVIAAAVENVGADALTLRMIVDGALPTALPEGVTVIAKRPEGTELETVRYRALTGIITELSQADANFIEIAGNDDIMLTVLSDNDTMDNAQSTMRRQGYNDFRHLIGVKVTDLADLLRTYAQAGVTVEHIHDY